MSKLSVNIADSSYDVHIGPNAYQLLTTEYLELFKSVDKIGIIADAHVASLHLSALQDSLQSLPNEVFVKTVPAGEGCKTTEVYTDCLSFLLENEFTRNSLVIAFGGGACGDLTGFVAATFMRGIRYIHCPTSILAHDSAVGGKTAINMPEGKNMVGAFHQPVAVLFDENLFATLPPREIRSGMAELIKHAFISDKIWTEELLANPEFSNPSLDWLASELLRGIQVKANIVEADEFEMSVRKYLNFGHTFGHAVEAVCGFGGLSHGECVMIGMAYSLLLSESNGSIDDQITNDFIRFSINNGYTFTPIQKHSFDTFYTYMTLDKKASFGKLNFVLLKEIGSPFVTEMTKEQLEEAFNQLRDRTEAAQ